MERGQTDIIMKNMSDSRLADDEHNVTYPDLPIDTRIAEIAVPVVFGFILISGIIGNGSVIAIVFKNRALRTVPNIYIVSLAIGDLILVLVSVPFSAFIYTFSSWYFGLFMCKFNEYLQTLSLGVSVFTLAVLSLDRYKAITEPMETHTERTLAKSLARVLAVWVASAVLAIPDAVMTSLASEYKTINNVTKVYYFCEQFPMEMPLYRKAQVVARFCVYFVGPLVVIAFCYILMAKTLFRNDSSGLMRDSTVRVERNKERMKVARLVLSFVAIFIICWFPRHIFMLWHNIGNHNFSLFWYIFKILGFCLSFINSCVNPIALYLQSQRFRKCFRRQFMCGDSSAPKNYMHMRQINGSKPTASTTLYN